MKQDRPRIERPLCARRLGAARRQPPSGERAADRRRNRQSPVGRALRQTRRRPVRYAGRNRIEARQHARCSSSLRLRRGERNVHRIPMRWTCISRAGLVEQRDDPRIHGASARLFRTCLGARSRKYRGAGRHGDVSIVAVGASFMTDDRTARLAAAEAALIKALSLAPNHALAHWSWASSKYLRTVRLKASPNASGRWRWIEIWPTLMVSSVWPSIFSAAARKPRPISTRHFASLLAISSPSGGCMFAGFAKLQLGADAEAVAWLRRSIEANRNYPVAHFLLAAALALLGALDQARAAAQSGTCARSNLHHPPLPR